LHAQPRAGPVDIRRMPMLLPVRPPHRAMAMFLAITGLVFLPCAVAAWLYADAELRRIDRGDVWAHGRGMRVAKLVALLAPIVPLAVLISGGSGACR